MRNLSRLSPFKVRVNDAAVQTVGRVVRHSDRKRLVVFADARYEELFKLFSKWLKSQRWYCARRLSELKDLIAHWNLGLPPNGEVIRPERGIAYCLFLAAETHDALELLPAIFRRCEVCGEALWVGVN